MFQNNVLSPNLGILRDLLYIDRVADDFVIMYLLVIYDIKQGIDWEEC